MSDVLEILKRGDIGLEALLRAVLLDSENKVPSDRLRIVGALSAGAIIERGSNANGEYVRWADGTQVCRFVTPAIGTESGQFSTTCTFPAQFISLPEVFGFNDIYIAPTTSFETVQAMLWGVINATITTTSCQISCIAFNITPSNRAGKFLAIGRWKA